MPFLQANYKRIHYADWAPEGSPTHTIVALHGLGSSQNYYGAMAELLNKSGVRVVALDTTGSGRSPYTFVEQTVSSLAQDIADALDALKISKAHIMGHSMCGLSVPHFAATYPERVEGLILLGPVHPAVVKEEVFNQRIEAVEKNGMQAMADVVPKAAVGSRATPLQRAFIRELLLGQEANGYISLCKVIIAAAKSGIAYDKITAPVVVIAGEEDKSAPLLGCECIIKDVQSTQKRLAILKGIGHWMAVETPDECVNEVIKFLSKRA